jgi:hypothetical protein
VCNRTLWFPKFIQRGTPPSVYLESKRPYPTKNLPSHRTLYGTGQKTDWNPDWHHAGLRTNTLGTSPALGCSETALKPSGRGIAKAGLLTLYHKNEHQNDIFDVVYKMKNDLQDIFAVISIF